MIVTFKGLKLKHQLFILITVALVMLIFFQAFYLSRFYPLIQKKYETSTESILNQVDQSLNNIANDIKNISTTLSYNKYTMDYVTSSDPAERYNDSRYLNEIADYIKASNGSIREVIIMDREGIIINNSTLSNLYSILDTIKNKYDLTLTGASRPIFTSLNIDTADYSYYLYIYPFSLLGSPENSEKIGTCIIICNRNYIQDFIDSVTLTPNSYLFITDNNSKVIASNKNAMVGKSADTEILKSFKDTENKVIKKIDGRNSILQRKKVEFLNWEIISVIPIDEITSDLQSTVNQGMYFTVLLLLILSIAAFIIGRNITRPISGLVHFMNNTIDTDIHKRIKNIEQNEVGQLAVHINKMLDKVQEMTRRMITTQSSLYEMELSKKQSEILALQSQINPHFLYNTLNCVRSIANTHNVQEIATIATCMSKIFRYSIKGSDFVKVSSEIECIKDYLEIMDIRYPGKFEIQYDISEEIMDIEIARFILQPIVENAIYHGLEQKLRKGLLRVTGKFLENGNIYLEVYDNGKGIAKEDMDRINIALAEAPAVTNHDKNKSIGILNIHNRLKFIYGEKYGLRIFSKEDEGTTVLIELPSSN